MPPAHYQHVGPGQEKEIAAMVARAERGEARLVPVALRGFKDLPENVRPFHGIVAPRSLLPDAVLKGLGLGVLNVDVDALAEQLLPLALRR